MKDGKIDSLCQKEKKPNKRVYYACMCAYLIKTWWERNTFNTHLNCFMWQRVLICVCVDVSPVVKATRRKSNKADDEKKKKKRWDDTIVLSSSQSSLLVLSAHHALHLSHTLAPLLPPSTVYHSHTLSYPSPSPCAPQQSLNLLFAIFASRSWWLHCTQTRTNVHPWFQRTFVRLGWNIYQCYCKSYLILSW